MEVLLGDPEPPSTVVDLSSGAPRSTTAPPHFSCQARQAPIPASICSGVELANISETDMPLNAASDRYRTKYFFMCVTGEPLTIGLRILLTRTRHRNHT